jgi:hypothetical protein
MKMLTKIWGTALLAIILMAIAPAKSSAQDDGGQYISTQEFYDQLAPYGTWVYDAKYGDVWVPDVDQDFRPYVTNGHWVYTSYGNTWVSDYEWGWATFHYGRWTYDDYYGWEWVPGSEWAPAWVDWRDGDGYYGWAPMTPEVAYNASYDDDYYNSYSTPDFYWSFAPYAYINYTNVYNYCVPYARVHTIYGRSNFIRNTYRYNNRVYVSGPRRDEIQRYTKRPVRLYTINNIDRPSRNTFDRNSVNFYRPDIRRDRNARPSRVIDGAAYRQQNPTQRIGGTDRRNGAVTQRENAGRLANEARSNNSRFVRTGNNRPDANTPNGQQAGGNGRFNRRPTDAGGAVQPGQQVNGQRPTRRPIDLNNPGQQAAEQQRQTRGQQRQQMQIQRQQQSEQQRQQADQQADQQREQGRQQQTDQQRQQADQSREQQRQQMQQQREQQTEQQRQQAEQIREQQRQQVQQQRQQQQQAGDQQTDLQRKQEQQQRGQQQRQQQEQIRQQQTEQQRQQAEQVREQQRQQVQQQRQQQTEQQRQQQDQQSQQQQEQQRQQQEQARQQQAEQQRQQQQQVREQQKQQQEQQRQQQQEQQRQQQEQARQQQAEQQRQQQQQAREQQRQQQEQQRQQPQQQPQRPTRP